MREKNTPKKTKPKNIYKDKDIQRKKFKRNKDSNKKDTKIQG